MKKPLKFFHCFTESQAEAGRDLWGSSLLTPLLKAGLSTAGCSGLYPGRFGRPPRMETLQPHWSMCASFFIILALKNFILLFKWNLFYFNLGPCPLGLLLDIAKEDPGTIFFTCPITCLYTLIRPFSFQAGHAALSASALRSLILLLVNIRGGE